MNGVPGNMRQFQRYIFMQSTCTEILSKHTRKFSHYTCNENVSSRKHEKDLNFWLYEDVSKMVDSIEFLLFQRQQINSKTRNFP